MMYGTISKDVAYFGKERIEKKQNESEFNFISRCKEIAEKKYNKKLIIT